MPKDIRSFAADMKTSLTTYKKTLEEDISYATRNAGESELKKLSTTLNDLRSYLTLCCGMIENIPDSKKIIAALNAKIRPLTNTLAIRKTGPDALIQARNVLFELSKITSK